jgi:hypothetical protein
MFDLATAKTRLNITGTAQDALLTVGINTALAVAERFCDRKFSYAAETVKFYHFYGDTLFLPRYPIESIVSNTGLPTQYKVHNGLGLIELHAPQSIEEVSISYTGGYKTLPPDLELALWSIFDTLWPSIQSGGTSSLGSSAVASITVPDVGTIRYDNSGAGAGAGAGGAGANSNLYGAFFSVLETYRRTTC